MEPMNEGRATVSEKTAACPHCRAENFLQRRTCWRCDQSLPTGFGLGPAPGAHYATAPRPTQFDIDQALEKAQVVSDDLPDQGEPKSGRLRWLFRKRAASP